MATQAQLESWCDALETLRLHKDRLREPDLSLVLAYERELAKIEAEENKPQ